MRHEHAWRLVATSGIGRWWVYRCILCGEPGYGVPAIAKATGTETTDG